MSTCSCTVVFMGTPSFKPGIWCSKSWLNAPIVKPVEGIPHQSSSMLPGNRIFCCQPGSYLRCSCPNYSDAEKKADAGEIVNDNCFLKYPPTRGCCPTTDYSVTSVSSVCKFGNMYNGPYNVPSAWSAISNDCISCPPGRYTAGLSLQRTCTACPKGWHQNEEGKQYCLPCERKYMNMCT